jgi:hypothetical protein
MYYLDIRTAIWRITDAKWRFFCSNYTDNIIIGTSLRCLKVALIKRMMEQIIIRINNDSLKHKKLATYF